MFPEADETPDLDGTIAVGRESVKQRVVQKLMFRSGTWYKDLTAGTHYFPSVFGVEATPELARATLTAACEEVSDVLAAEVQINEFDPMRRALDVSIRLSTEEGDISFTFNG